MSLRALAETLTACFLVLALVHFMQKADPVASSETRPKRSLAVWRATLQPAPWISLALLFCLYVGIEISVGGWVALDEKRLVGFSTAKMAAAPAFFYGFLLLARFLVPFALKHFSQLTLCVGGLALTTVGVVLVAFAQTPVVLHAGALLAGLGCGAPYPTYVTWLAANFKKDATWLAGPVFWFARVWSSVVSSL